MKSKVLRGIVPLLIAILLVSWASGPVFALEGSNTATTPLQRFLNNLRNTDSEGEGTGKMYYLTVTVKCQSFADGDTANSKFEITVTTNKGTDNEKEEKVTLKNASAKVTKVSPGSSYSIAPKADPRYNYTFDGAKEGTIEGSVNVTILYSRADTFTLTIENSSKVTANIMATVSNGKEDHLQIKAGETKKLENLAKDSEYSLSCETKGVSITNEKGKMTQNITCKITDATAPNATTPEAGDVVLVDDDDDTLTAPDEGQSVVDIIDDGNTAVITDQTLTTSDDDEVVIADDDASSSDKNSGPPTGDSSTIAVYLFMALAAFGLTLASLRKARA